MGTTFVTADSEPDAPAGFWISDCLLELWLRLLALHLPEPVGSDDFQPSKDIRDGWMLASRGHFVGCIPHGMVQACATTSGRRAVRAAINGLVAALGRSEAPLDAETLNLLGIENGLFTTFVERRQLREVARAFVDLLDGKIATTASSGPYHLGLLTSTDGGDHSFRDTLVSEGVQVDAG